eukprot:1610959-Pyramimonas_sp.AAC.1
MVQDASITASDGPKTAQDHLGTSQDALKTAQQGSNVTSNRARRCQNHRVPLGLLEPCSHYRLFQRPSAQGCARGLQNSPTTAQEGLKIISGIARFGFSRSESGLDWTGLD